jgi:hypothetical protein
MFDASQEMGVFVNHMTKSCRLPTKLILVAEGKNRCGTIEIEIQISKRWFY